jgi:hypothetical protein
VASHPGRLAKRQLSSLDDVPSEPAAAGLEADSAPAAGHYSGQQEEGEKNLPGISPARRPAF